MVVVGGLSHRSRRRHRGGPRQRRRRWRPAPTRRLLCRRSPPFSHLGGRVAGGGRAGRRGRFGKPRRRAGHGRDRPAEPAPPGSAGARRCGAPWPPPRPWLPPGWSWVAVGTSTDRLPAARTHGGRAGNCDGLARAARRAVGVVRVGRPVVRAGWRRPLDGKQRRGAQTRGAPQGAGNRQEQKTWGPACYWLCRDARATSHKRPNRNPLGDVRGRHRIGAAPRMGRPLYLARTRRTATAPCPVPPRTPRPSIFQSPAWARFVPSSCSPCGAARG